MWVLVFQDGSPKFFGLSLNQITSLKSKEVVLISNFDQFIITLTPASLISQNCQVWVSAFAEFSDFFGIIELIVLQEGLWFLISIDLDFSEGIVNSG